MADSGPQDSLWHQGIVVFASSGCAFMEKLEFSFRLLFPPSQVSNASKGIEAAYNDLGVPKLISAADLTHPECDELRSARFAFWLSKDDVSVFFCRVARAERNFLFVFSIITYVSCFREAQRIIRKSKADEFMEARKVGSINLSFGDFFLFSRGSTVSFENVIALDPHMMFLKPFH